MKFTSIGYKILALVGISVTLVLISMMVFYTKHQENSILAQNERAMRQLAESVTQGLQSVMLAGYADIAQAFADRLKKVPEIADFRILRVDGTEAFRDNKTLVDVNRRRGEEAFAVRETEEVVRVLEAEDDLLKKVLSTKSFVTSYGEDSKGNRQLNFLAPIENLSPCYKCHGKAHEIRGVLKISTSMVAVENDILRLRIQSLLGGGIALLAIMGMVGYMVLRSVVRPIVKVTDALSAASAGNLRQYLAVESRDELGIMAGSFNTMTLELLTTYDGLHREQDKLNTIISSSNEGIVVTDKFGNVVLVNPAAERLLGKSMEKIQQDGFANLLDNPEQMNNWLAQEHGGTSNLSYNHHIMNVIASTTKDNEGHVTGSACLLRDITEQKRLEEELRRLATTDALTSLYNRRHLDTSLKAELERSKRYKTPLSIFMFDVDHFKIFNDEHGHDMGDLVLRTLGSHLKDALRTHDIPCRYGGEEFLAILPNTLADGAWIVAERFRQEVENLLVEGLRVTISIGIASYPDLEPENADLFVEMADKAMYESKHAGRNRVTIAKV